MMFCLINISIHRLPRVSTGNNREKHREEHYAHDGQHGVAVGPVVVQLNDPCDGV